MKQVNDKPGTTSTLTFADAFVIMIGGVIGAGVFKTPSLVTASAGNPWTSLAFWIMGGIVTFIGAMCYAEIATAFPGTGGEYSYIYRSYGSSPAFLFAWSRMMVIQTGSIAFLAFLIGDYAAEIFPVGEYSSSIFAALAVCAITAINLKGVTPGKRFQHLVVIAMAVGLLTVAVSGITSYQKATWDFPESLPGMNSIGSAMVFVLLTFGGWNEAVYLSGELRDVRRNMVRVFLAGSTCITLVYIIINALFLNILGVQGVVASDAVAADMMRTASGEWGAGFISVLIVITAAGTLNAVVITGARTNYALGKQFKLFRVLGYWWEEGGTPSVALIAQAIISLMLIALGAVTRGGFVMMVEYTAPVFWFFFLLTGLSLFVLRKKYPDIERPFVVPLYPATPFLFCCMCLFMLWSSVAYTGKGALWGVVVMLTGIPFLVTNKMISGKT